MSSIWVSQVCFSSIFCPHWSLKKAKIDCCSYFAVVSKITKSLIWDNMRSKQALQEDKGHRLSHLLTIMIVDHQGLAYRCQSLRVPAFRNRNTLWFPTSTRSLKKELGPVSSRACWGCPGLYSRHDRLAILQTQSTVAGIAIAVWLCKSIDRLVTWLADGGQGFCSKRPTDCGL